MLWTGNVPQKSICLNPLVMWRLYAIWALSSPVVWLIRCRTSSGLWDNAAARLPVTLQKRGINGGVTNFTWWGIKSESRFFFLRRTFPWKQYALINILYIFIGHVDRQIFSSLEILLSLGLSLLGHGVNRGSLGDAAQQILADTHFSLLFSIPNAEKSMHLKKCHQPKTWNQDFSCCLKYDSICQFRLVL